MSNPIDSDALFELALDLRWSFNHAADTLWERLDPVLWNLTHNPWFVLQTLSRERREAATADPEFKKLVDELLLERRQAEASPTWFQQTHPHAPLGAVAYFSMEYMLSEALPIYSGGLGNVAGDQLKTSSTLGVPVVGVGLLYQQGYFRQEIDAQGRQQARYPFNDPGLLPIRPKREANGEWLRFSIPYPGEPLWIRVWRVQIGRARLYLLDTNDPANTPMQRTITGELYGGDAELRLKQELVLGIGGWRLLSALGVHPEVCHLNEGHAAFAVLERARSYMNDQHQSFELALAVTRAGNLFTTHTPVEAGFDRFAPDLMARYLRSFAERDLGIAFDDLLALGRRDRHDASEPFNMAYLAIRGCGAVNGVSRLHGEVSRRIFQPLFPRWPEVEVPVAHITNGVHMPTWDSSDADRLWEAACGKERWRRMAAVEDDFRRVSDADLWRFREAARESLVRYVRDRMGRQLAEQGASTADVARSDTIFDRQTLTVGFARRFATYKRPNLLLHDPDRLVRILTNGQRPVQLVIAGKAHPEDAAGQALIQQWIAFVQRPSVSGRVVFLCDYDMLMAERLVQGIDLWINTPRRPWEACGTSGMKVLVNGGLNLSELDGWWAEAYAPDVGWAIGDGKDRGDDPSWDAAEADALYALLEGEISAAFYTRDEHGIPRAWVARMRASLARLTPRFASNRTVREYTETRYLQAAERYNERAADRGRLGAELLAWRDQLERHWGSATFGTLDVQRDGEHYIFRVQIDFGQLDPQSVLVELYAVGQNGASIREPMRCADLVTGSANRFLYVARVPGSRPSSDFTPRLMSFHSHASVPLEAPFILWYDRPVS
ncbi:MAG TPA: alpha-glucan family phosphorylase [Vicinamibacterales bacterium]|jgi:starch phosphorylase|nr:alpha-glucan family phosphorylase [Vicinamibacterales bacterium]